MNQKFQRQVVTTTVTITLVRTLALGLIVVGVLACPKGGDDNRSGQQSSDHQQDHRQLTSRRYPQPRIGLQATGAQSDNALAIAFSFSVEGPVM